MKSGLDAAEPGKTRLVAQVREGAMVKVMIGSTMYRFTRHSDHSMVVPDDEWSSQIDDRARVPKMVMRFIFRVHPIRLCHRRGK
jgi:hypothetical protein